MGALPARSSVLNPDVEPGLEVILVGSSELSPPPSPLGAPSRELVAQEVRSKQRRLEDLCICCGSLQVHTQHPLFEGGMCSECKDRYVERLFLFDDDGSQSYCAVCASGDTLLLCEDPDCTRCYCFACVDTLVSPGTAGRVQAMSRWACFLCLPFPHSGLLRRRDRWRRRLKAFYDQEAEDPLEVFKTVSVWKREPVRVLCLFGDIRRELTSLGLLEAGARPGQLRQLDDVTNVVRKDVDAWGPFDLVFGSTPPLGQACDHPAGWYLFQFHRLLQYARPQPPGRPFFWMFTDHLALSEDNQAIATRFLETEPATLQDVRGRTILSAARVWSNVPALRSRHQALGAEEEASLRAQAQQRPRPSRPAALLRPCFLPLREYFKSCPLELSGLPQPP